MSNMTRSDNEKVALPLAILLSALAIALGVVLASLLITFLLPVPAHAAEADVVSWRLLRNGLVLMHIDRDGDGQAEQTELHVLKMWSRSVLSDEALRMQAAQDNTWLLIVEGEVGRLVYFVSVEPLFVCEERFCKW